MPTVTRALRIRATSDALYALWRDPIHLPHILRGVEGITVTGVDTARWAFRAPTGTLWDVIARITRDEPDTLLVWKAQNLSFAASVAVRFEPLDDGTTRTTLQVTLDPPGGLLVDGLVASYLTSVVEHSLRNLAALYDTSPKPHGIAEDVSAQKNAIRE